MASLFVGIACLLLGIVGIFAWSHDFFIVLKGALPPILILVGALALFLGLDTLKEKSSPVEEEEAETEAAEIEPSEKKDTSEG